MDYVFNHVGEEGYLNSKGRKVGRLGEGEESTLLEKRNPGWLIEKKSVPKGSKGGNECVHNIRRGNTLLR